MISLSGSSLLIHSTLCMRNSTASHSGERYSFFFILMITAGLTPLTDNLQNKSVEPTIVYSQEAVEGPAFDKLQVILHTRPDMEYLPREPRRIA